MVEVFIDHLKEAKDKRNQDIDVGCFPTCSEIARRFKLIFTLPGFVWCLILFNNGTEIYALFLLLCLAKGEPGALLSVVFFFVAIFLVILL
jgi:hypothetical protein